MKEKLLQIRKMIQESVNVPLDENALEILSISIYAISSLIEPLEIRFPIALGRTHFVVGQEDICTLFTKEFGRVEHQLDTQASAACVKKYTYEAENDTMYSQNYFLLSTQLKNSAETIVRTCGELFHLLRSGKPKIVGDKVRIVNGINVDVINTSDMNFRRKHVTFENALINLSADKVVQVLAKEISFLTHKELQTISPLLARFGSEISSYPYDIYSYEKNVIKGLCICPSLANALNLPFSENEDVSTFAERFNSIFCSSSAFSKFSRALDDVAERGREALNALLTIQHVLLHVRDKGLLETFEQPKETLKK